MISDILDKDLLQDALGILHFPSSGNASIRRHIAEWIAKTIPDPFAQQPHDEDTISKLHRIFSRIIIFVEDYVSKATDPFPPRAYLALPPIVSGGDRLFKGQAVGIKLVPFNDLTTQERRRLAGAFLKYEMICLVHNPRVWTILKGSRHADLVLEKYEKLPFAQIKEVYSVYEYVKAVYGAIFAHCQDAWLPDRPIASPSEPSSTKEMSPPTKNRLIYPDTVYFSPGDYFADLGGAGYARQASILPFLGLDLLTKLLVSFNADREYGQYVKTWLFACTREIDPYYRSWDLQNHLLSRYERSVDHDSDLLLRGLHPDSCRNRMTIIQQHNQFQWSIGYSRDAWVRQQRQHQFQVMIYRQRAWGLFDNTRLYSNIEKHFPTMDDLDEQAASQPIGVFYKRPRRRSQRWHDWYLGRSLESPLEREREESLRGETPREQERVEDNHGCLGRFFEKQTPGKLPTFWR
ncbi:hypothetical protein FDECE_15812 [Fusarium decemcellulare]|nr:hypothetical protein FDECE_15812 [Fusarium decemcellulare]